MALTDKQIKELDLASQRKLGGTATDTDIKNLEYAYGKGYSYKPNQDLYIGATNWANLQQQYAPNVLEQATQRVGGDIFWNPNVNIEDLISQPVNAGEVTPSVPVVGTFKNINKLMAGIDTSNKGLQAQLEQIMLPTQSQARKDQIDEQFRVATEEQKTAQRDLQEDTWARFGLEQNIEQLQSIMPQIAKVEADYMAMMEEIKNQPLSSRIIGGTADRLQRQKAVELAGLSAVAQAYQGNVDLARNITQDALNAQFQDQQNYLQNLRLQLDSVESNLSREEKRKADALNLVINERERLISEERQERQGILELAMSIASAGGNSSDVSKILNSKTIEEALMGASDYIPQTGVPTNLGGGFWSWGGNVYTDDQLKQMVGNITTGSTGSYGGQCGDYLHSIMNVGTRFGDLYEEKSRLINVSKDNYRPEIGDILIFKTNMPYGHVSAVTDINGNKITITESNLKNDEKIGERVLDLNNMPNGFSGVYRGATFKQVDSGISDDEIKKWDKAIETELKKIRDSSNREKTLQEAFDRVRFDFPRSSYPNLTDEIIMEHLRARDILGSDAIIRDERNERDKGILINPNARINFNDPNVLNLWEQTKKNLGL